MNEKLLLGYSPGRRIFLVLLAVLFTPFFVKGQDTLFYQGWEGEPGKNGLHGFEQYNNQTWSQQNVWSRTGVSGVNPAGASTFYVLNPLPPSKQCNDSPFDSCLVSESANFTGANGAHIITGAYASNMNYANLNQNHSGYHTGPFCPYPFGCDGNTAASSVGLYSPKIKLNKSYTQVKVEFWCKVNGELNRDYGSLRYSTKPNAPQPPIPDGVKNMTAPDNYWKTVTYSDGAAAQLADPIYTYEGDTLYSLPMKPQGSTIPGQLQGFVGPKNSPLGGKPVWVKLSYILPAEAAGDTNLRIAFWWNNDNNGWNEQTGFPALTVDDVRVIGYKFSINELSDNFFCPKEKISIPFQLDRKFFNDNISGKDNEFVAHLTDSTGNFIKAKNIGKIDFASLTFDKDLVTGTIVGEIPTNVPQLPIGGYRVKVVAPVSGYESAICPTVITIFPVPQYTLTPKDTSVCPGEKVEFHVEGIADRYHWYRNHVLVGETQVPHWTASDSGTYQVKALINGCISFSNEAFLRYKASPDTRLKIADDQDTVCYLTKIAQIQGGSPAGGVYFWYYEGREPNTGRTEVRGQHFDSYLAGVGIHTIGYEVVNNETGCRDVAYDTIFVADIPFATINNADTATLCKNQNLDLTLSKSAKSILWSTGQSTQSIQVTKSGTYSATLTNEYGCSYTARIVVVDVPPVPQAPTINEVRVGDTQVSGTAVPSPYSKPPSVVNVFVNDKKVATVTVNRKTNTYVAFLTNPLNAGDKVGVQLSYDTDCDGVLTVKDTPSPMTVVVVEEELIDIPTGISPNGDGKNDTWVVVKRIRERFPNADVYIFNRWGSEVYHKEGYDNTFDGKDLPDDTYYYVVDFKTSGQEIRKGYLMIMR